MRSSALYRALLLLKHPERTVIIRAHHAQRLLLEHHKFKLIIDALTVHTAFSIRLLLGLRPRTAIQASMVNRY